MLTDNNEPVLTQLTGGRPSVLLLSPVLADARIWGTFSEVLGAHAGVTLLEWPGHGQDGGELPERLDPLASVEQVGIAGLGTAQGVDVVVAIGPDAAAAVHLGATDRVRGIVLIRPQSLDWPAEFELDDTDIESMPVEQMEALTTAIVAQDAAAYGTAMAAAEDRLSPEVRGRLAQMYADHFSVLMKGPEWVHIPPNWHESLRAVAAPVVVLVPAERVAPGMTRQLGSALAQIAPRGEVRDISSSSEYPWLVEPDEVLAAVVQLLEQLK